MLAESILIGGTAFSALALATAIIKNSGQSSFLYANARITARTTYIMDKAKLSSLLDSKNLPELINNLKDTEYYPYLESIDKTSMTQFNIALEKGLINSLNEIRNISPKHFKKIFDVYTKIYESKLIKTFFRSRFSKIKIERALLEPIGEINPILMKHLHDTKSIADIKLVLRDTEYKKLFEKEYKNIEEFDLELEKSVLNDIDDSLKEIKTFDKKILSEIFLKRREIKYILTLLKSRLRNKRLEDIEIKDIDIKKAIDLPDLKSSFSKL
jgi:vacuolar-type H+-ATPase subunit C/Vma6